MQINNKQRRHFTVYKPTTYTTLSLLIINNKSENVVHFVGLKTVNCKKKCTVRIIQKREGTVEFPLKQ
jgi:hypothetical protein